MFFYNISIVRVLQILLQHVMAWLIISIIETITASPPKFCFFISYLGIYFFLSVPGVSDFASLTASVSY